MKKYTSEFTPRGVAADGYELLLEDMNGSPVGRYHAAKKAGFDVEMLLSEAPTVIKNLKPLDKDVMPENDDAIFPRAFDVRKLQRSDRWLTLFKGERTAINGYVPNADGNFSTLTRDHDADHLWFIYNGTGTCHTDFGKFLFHAGDFIFIPRGTLTSFVTSGARMIGIESKVGLRKRARSAFDNVMVPFNNFAVKLPVPTHVDDCERIRRTLVRRGGKWSEVEYAYKPFLCLVWQGTPYPFAIHSSKLNLPHVVSAHPDPSNFAAFAAPDGSAMVSVLGPRHVHSLPYDHDNPLTEVLFSAKDYDARKGSSGGVGDSGTATVHPMGIWHGPQMAAFEDWKKPGSPKELPWKDDLAIMFETADTLYPCKDVLPILIENYEKSWLQSWEEYQKKHPRGMGGVGGW